MPWIVGKMTSDPEITDEVEALIDDAIEENEKLYGPIESMAPLSEWVCNDQCVAKQVIQGLNEDDLEQLQGIKTNFGWTLNKATINAQQKNIGGVGISAGDADSYKQFSRVFDEVIQLHHGFTPSKSSAKEEDYGEIKLPDLPEVDAIKSTRISAGRNLDGFPFTCNMTLYQRLKVEAIMKRVFEGIEDPNLKGTYYPLDEIEKAGPTSQLYNYHDLFQFTNDGDIKDMDGSAYDKWRKGSGIFINNDHSNGVFIVCVGEKDQIRILAMKEGSDVQAAWDLFYKGLETIHKGILEAKQDFAFDQMLGYLSSCPTNLGTGMLASIHVDLPAFASIEAVNDKVKESDLQIDIRDSKFSGTVYEFSSASQLRSTMSEQISMMMDGIVELLIGDLGTSGWVSNDHCLVKQVLKEMDLETLKSLHKVTTDQGWTLKKATITAQKRNQHVGVYAGDVDSYAKLAPVLDEVIRLYHGINRETNTATKESYGKQELPTLPKGDAIKSTRIRTARNFEGLPFTCNMTKVQRLEVEGIMKSVFQTFTDPYLKGTYYPLTGMDEKTRMELIDAHYLFINDDPTLELVGAYDDWSHGRGIFINDDRSTGVFIVWVGEEDQLRIMAMNKGSDVQAVWDLFYSGLEAVHKGCLDLGRDFAFDNNLGYLSACPTNIGTGMRASVHVDLPAFATKEAVKAKVKELGMQIDVRGTRGEATDTSGCTVYDISNKARLGSTMPEQVNTMVRGVDTLLWGGRRCPREHTKLIWDTWGKNSNASAM